MVKVDFVSCGHFHDLMGYRKKGDQSIAKRLELIRGRDCLLYTSDAADELMRV